MAEQLDQIGIDPAAIVIEGTPRSLVASLQLSLELLDDAARHAVRRLGVFQGGAFEDDLLAITELDESQWQPLRRQLESAALIERYRELTVRETGVTFIGRLAQYRYLNMDQIVGAALHTFDKLEAAPPAPGLVTPMRDIARVQVA